MRIIDNLNEFLGDDLKTSIKPGSKLRIAASTFSIFAFEALKRELQSIKELEFIFTAPSFTTTKATDKPAPGKTVVLHSERQGPGCRACPKTRRRQLPPGQAGRVAAGRRLRAARRPSLSRRGAALHHSCSALFGRTVGYGYRPGRVLWMLAALLVTVTVTVLVPDARATFRATDPAANVYATSGRLITVAVPDTAAPQDRSPFPRLAPTSRCTASARSSTRSTPSSRSSPSDSAAPRSPG